MLWSALFQKQQFCGFSLFFSLHKTMENPCLIHIRSSGWYKLNLQESKELKFVIKYRILSYDKNMNKIYIFLRDMDKMNQFS